MDSLLKAKETLADVPYKPSIVQDRAIAMAQAQAQIAIAAALIKIANILDARHP